MNDGTRSLVL